MTKKLKSILTACILCSLIFTSCAKEETDIKSEECTTISSSDNIQTEEISQITTNFTVTENTKAIATEQKYTYDDLSTCAGTLTYDLCEKAAIYCSEHEIFPDKLTACDYNLDGRADIFIDGGLITCAGKPVAAVISDGFNSFSYYNGFDFIPALYKNNITGEKEFIAVAGDWYCSDVYSMEVYSINGNNITLPYAAVPLTGYIGGGFTKFGFYVTENIPIEDSGYNLEDNKYPDDNYPELFYSGMDYSDCYVFMQNYTKCEDVPQLTVATSYKFPDDINNICNTESVAQEFYRMFSNPVPVEPDKIGDGFNTEKGSIICVNEVKDTDTAQYLNFENSKISLSVKVCKNAIDFLYKNITDENDAVTAPYDVNNDGIAEMLVGIYQRTGENPEDKADIYCIYENGAIEMKSDYKLHWGTFITEEGTTARGTEVSYILGKNTSDKYAAQKLYLLFTNNF